MTLPIIGAALSVLDLPAHETWLRELPRDLELQDFCQAELLDADWQSVAAKALQHLDGHEGRLGIHGPFWGWTIASYDADVRAVVRKRLNQGLDVCEMLGATQMVIHSPFTTWGYNHRGMFPSDADRMLSAARDTLGAALDRADAMGVTMVVENIEDKEPADRAALCEALGWKALALSVDTGHAHYAHGSTGAPPVDSYIRAAGNHLNHVHLQDADGYADRHWQLGHGTVLWHSVFSALGNITSNPRLIIELRDKAGVIPSAKHLKALGLGQ